MTNIVDVLKDGTEDDRDAITSLIPFLQEELGRILGGDDVEVVVLVHKRHTEKEECEGVTVLSDMAMEDSAAMIYKALAALQVIMMQNHVPQPTLN